MADYKPNDFFVGVIDFFGIIIPGAVLLYLRGEYLLDGLIGKVMPATIESIADWCQFLIGSYIMGQILLGAGVPLNMLIKIYSPERKDEYYNEVRESIDLPKPIKNRENVFHRAYSFVRLNSEHAIAEIERQAAEYKLFRSLSIVFLLDFLLALVSEANWHRALTSGVLFVISGARFLFLLNWTWRITFEFYALLIKSDEKKHDATKMG